ncbi:MAG: hypothetical protein RMI94_13550 [Bryobacterales bacterium]|nr:class I SAM-dependent methyltransferase [Bryobacteraceae bacterium]MDW8131570.1 hypothetical protein [Bryobacterales bacterium]
MATHLAHLDIREICRRAERFDEVLEAARRRIEQRGRRIAWYPYRSLSGLVLIEKLLTGEWRRLLALAGDDPVLDLGCADGELAFFLESLGLRVHAVDYPETNCNAMEGVRALKDELGSSVEILGVDLDAQFTLPGHRYGLAFFLGTLYHLKNPYYALETLAGYARYCVLSTRIAAFAQDGKTPIRHLPVACLLREGEANQDWTNYWVFSEAGLRLLLERTGWRVLAFATFGSTHSDPVTAEGDERAFCLLRSLPLERQGQIEFVRGWHQIEYGTWRWTEREFAVLAPLPAGMRPMLKLRFFLPETVIAKVGPLTLAATVEGRPLAAETYRKPGEYVYARGLAGGQPGRRVLIEFRLDRALPPDDSDPRERGLVVSSLTIE